MNTCLVDTVDRIRAYCTVVMSFSDLLILRVCMCILLLVLRPGRGAVHCHQFVCLSVCLSASISLQTLDRSLRNFVRRSPVAVARSSSGGVAIAYVLPVLWMTSRLAVVGRKAKRGLSVAKYSVLSGVARPGQSMMSMNALFVLHCMCCRC